MIQGGIALFAGVLDGVLTDTMVDVLSSAGGVLIFGIIQTAIIFDGRLSSWWTCIAVGILLLAFILLQQLLQRTIRRAGSRDAGVATAPA